jgi:hypothetical protein
MRWKNYLNIRDDNCRACFCSTNLAVPFGATLVCLILRNTNTLKPLSQRRSDINNRFMKVLNGATNDQLRKMERSL